MANAQNPTATQVARRVLLPAALMFALPLFSLWFSQHTLDKWDAEALAGFESNLARAGLPQEELRDKLAFVRKHSFSEVCTGSDDETAGLRASLGSNCNEVKQFHWATRAAQAALVFGLLAALLMALSTLGAFADRSLQLVSLKVGWNGLQVISAIEVILQGALVAWLSFWITAEWFGIYIPKLIIIAVCLAAVGIFGVIKAIFSRPDSTFRVDAEILTERDAPDFWKHLRRLAAKLDTPAPDNVLVGIDNNFFVTEGDVTVGETVVRGRTLFASLSLLRQLEQTEADAVLIHELGHLLGGDTGRSKQLAPYLIRFDHYLVALAENPMSWPIFAFMRAYATLFHLALSKSQREAELAADALAVQWTSAGDLARSLVTISAFHAFRMETEDALFGQDQHQQSPDLAARLATGFDTFARSSTLKEALKDLDGVGIPHPFDSHPPTSTRLAAAGATLTLDEVPALLQREVRHSWIARIPVAEAIEGRLWAAYNARFSEAHEFMLAYRYEPANDAERAHVERFFPLEVFRQKGKNEGEGEDTQVDCVGVTSPDVEGLLSFDDVESAAVNERLLKRYLDVKLKDGREKKKQSICLSKLQDPDGFLQAFERYLQRHNASVSYRQALAEEAEAAKLAAG